jgi:hypothetical protein
MLNHLHFLTLMEIMKDSGHLGKTGESESHNAGKRKVDSKV